MVAAPNGSEDDDEDAAPPDRPLFRPIIHEVRVFPILSDAPRLATRSPLDTITPNPSTYRYTHADTSSSHKLDVKAPQLHAS
mmetsp:Transcript_8875/g.19056  ORF Transcript_8875/g.19056 Transcript_8875/m.19056 type:complete len:82 (-) Transcript_8875:16-261(-)